MHKTEQSVMILSGQMGYEILLPANRLLRWNVQQETAFYTYLHVREDAMQLYGFDSWEERDFFLQLLNVSGVGPKGALAIIGQAAIATIHEAIIQENIGFLTKLPGVGKKTAQRLVLELKDKLPALSEHMGSMTIESVKAVDSTLAKDEIFDVLVSFGYHESEIRKIYPQLKQVANDLDEQALIKQALKLLSSV